MQCDDSGHESGTELDFQLFGEFGSGFRSHSHKSRNRNINVRHFIRIWSRIYIQPFGDSGSENSKKWNHNPSNIDPATQISRLATKEVFPELLL